MPADPENEQPPLRIGGEPNVLVSAAITAGVSRQVVQAAAAGDFTLVVCPLLLGELEGVLSRPRFERWRTRAELDEFVRLIIQIADSVADPDDVPAVTRDPGDDYLVALARSARCSVVCSGDPDLHDAEVEDISVLAPRALLEALHARHLP